MTLPFTHDQFLDVFAAYNAAFWPLAAVLWLVTAGALGTLASGRPASRLLAGLLSVHWLTSGAAYHLVHFRVINPAATLFALAFILEAVLFAWFGVLRAQLTFECGRSPRQILGAALSVYALAYPALALASGMQWPRVPLFAVPCPTTLLTAGLLLLTPARQLRGLAVVPILWSVVGGSAALILGVRPDLMLIAAGALLGLHVIVPRLMDAKRAA